MSQAQEFFKEAIKKANDPAIKLIAEGLESLTREIEQIKKDILDLKG